MKSKIIKNFGLLYGSSNIIFAGKSSGDKGEKVEEKLEDKQEFKGMCDLLKGKSVKGVDSKKLTEEIFSNFYNCEKKEVEENKKKIVKLNFTLNFDIKQADIKEFFKSKIKTESGKENVIILKEKPEIEILQDTKEQILNKYKNLINTKCIILELNQDGSVKEFFNTNEKASLDALKKLTGNENFDTKEIFEKAIAITDNTSENTKAILQALNKAKLGFGIHKLNSNNISVSDGFKGGDSSRKSAYVVLLMNNNNVEGRTCTIIDHTIEATIKSNIKSISLAGVPESLQGTHDKLKPEDIIICYNKVGGENYILIAKAEDVSKGKIGDKIIDKEFYKSNLEEFFKTVNKLGNDVNPFKGLINIFIDKKYDCGQYQLTEEEIKNIRHLFNEHINLTLKGLEWICLRKDETSGKSFCTDVFKKNIEFKEKSEKNVTVNGMKPGGCYLKKDDIIVAVESNKNLLLIAKGSDISAGTVNGLTIDNNFYVKPTK